MREIAAAVPRVATIAKPRSCSCAAMPTAPALSESVTVRNTVPVRGSRAPAAACAFANAAGKSCGHAHDLAGRAHLRPEQRVRPGEAVERHHRLLDRDVVAAADRRAGRARPASPPASPGTRSWPAGSRSPWRRTAPSATRAGSPRSRRGRRRAPRTARSSARPRRARARAARSPRAISSRISRPSECGGSTQAESPEWMPASSTCCMTPPIQTSSPSQIASTSTSTAFSRKRSRKISRPCEPRATRSR